jgi:hypothetical protein
MAPISASGAALIRNEAIFILKILCCGRPVDLRKRPKSLGQKARRETGAIPDMPPKVIFRRHPFAGRYALLGLSGRLHRQNLWARAYGVAVGWRAQRAIQGSLTPHRSGIEPTGARATRQSDIGGNIRLWNSDMLANVQGAARHILSQAAACLGSTNAKPLLTRKGEWESRVLPERQLSSTFHRQEAPAAFNPGF